MGGSGYAYGQVTGFGINRTTAVGQYFQLSSVLRAVRKPPPARGQGKSGATHHSKWAYDCVGKLSAFLSSGHPPSARGRKEAGQRTTAVGRSTKSVWLLPGHCCPRAKTFVGQRPVRWGNGKSGNAIFCSHGRANLRTTYVIDNCTVNAERRCLKELEPWRSGLWKAGITA
ncbi:unnamed protein product [Calypogeia fissa]